MWFPFLTAFYEKKIDTNAIPQNIWENSLNLSKGRVTKDFVKWFIETHLKLAKNTQILRDENVQGQFLVKDQNNNLIYIVRDFNIAEKSQPDDYLETERVIVNQEAEREGLNLALIKKTFKRMFSKDGLTIKGPERWKTIIELENAIYVYPFARNIPLFGQFKKERIYLTVTDVKQQGVQLKDVLQTPEALEALEHVGRSLAMWHLKSKFAAYVTPFDVGFHTTTQGDFIPENVLYNANRKAITFLNNNQMADTLRAGGKSNWCDIKTFIKTLNATQRHAFFKGYAAIFKRKGYAPEKMEEFTRTATFKNLDMK
ncbi:MAG: hypothetical protein H6850_03865 [Alphaproteobacteria bacterium]|nr:MAG: hypothetical protein H6850_03865 [Alphaproteobacteria bacterium]